jgi:hypothetical protein
MCSPWDRHLPPFAEAGLYPGGREIGNTVSSLALSGLGVYGLYWNQSPLPVQSVLLFSMLTVNGVASALNHYNRMCIYSEMDVTCMLVSVMLASWHSDAIAVSALLRFGLPGVDGSVHARFIRFTRSIPRPASRLLSYRSVGLLSAALFVMLLVMRVLRPVLFKLAFGILTFKAACSVVYMLAILPLSAPVRASLWQMFWRALWSVALAAACWVAAEVGGLGLLHVVWHLGAAYGAYVVVQLVMMCDLYVNDKCSELEMAEVAALLVPVRSALDPETEARRRALSDTSQSEGNQGERADQARASGLALGETGPRTGIELAPGRLADVESR